MAEFMGKLPDENEYRDQAAEILDMQNPGTTGFDREERIQIVAQSLGELEVYHRTRGRTTRIVKRPESDKPLDDNPDTLSN
jgi:hypothetical protein